MPSIIPDPNRDGSFELILPNDRGNRGAIGNEAGTTPKVYIKTAGNGFEVRSTTGTVLFSVTEAGAISTLTVPVAAAAPGSPTAGQIYFNSVDLQFYGWDGSQWVVLG